MLMDFADCVVASDPYTADFFYRTGSGSDEEKRAIFQHFQSVTVPPGTVLITKGEMGQGLYLILRGECDVIDAGADGRELSLPPLREGDFFGELALLSDQPRSATVRAVATDRNVSLIGVQHFTWRTSRHNAQCRVQRAAKPAGCAGGQRTGSRTSVLAGVYHHRRRREAA